jgi:L-fuculose-phosphate aldolase
VRANRQLRQDVVRYAQALHQRGWVANHDGNISARIGAGRFLATPTATSKEDVTEANLLEVDDQGNKVAGTSRRFSEINLHLAVFANRSDVNAVVHAHPPNATAVACSGSNIIERPFIAEAVVSLGATIPLLPFARPGKDAANALTPVVGECDAVLLANHGVLSWGPSVELAYLRMELVEHLARIALLAQANGGVRPLPDDAIPPLLEARAKAGLGQAADKAGGKQSVIACAPAPHANVEVRQRPDIAAIIREEVVRSLKDRS